MTTPIAPTQGGTIITGQTKGVFIPGAKVSREGEYTLADVDPIGRWEGIIVGRPGSGKTVVAGTFPGPFRWLAADGPTCTKSLRWAFKEGKMSIKSMEDVRIFTPVEKLMANKPGAKDLYAQNPDAFNQCCDRVDFWFSPGEVETWENGTLVIDSTSQVNEWTMNQALSVNSKLPKPDKPLSASHKINTEAGARILRGKQDYNSAMALFEPWIADIRVQCARHNRNLILLCHEWYEEERDDDAGVRKIVGIKPALYGQLRETLPKSFDDVWYMQVYNGKEFKVQVHADPLRDAKTRWGAVLNREEPADYRQLIKKIRDYHGIKSV